MTGPAEAPGRASVAGIRLVGIVEAPLAAGLRDPAHPRIAGTGP
jgi:hypothetical protein